MLFFTATHPTCGREVWMSDGTSEGTALVADITPGYNEYGHNHLMNVNDTLLFSADDIAHGRELWAVTLSGSCCFVDDSCVAAPSPTLCGLGHGVYQGYGTSCADACTFGPGGDFDRDGYLGMSDFRALAECMTRAAPTQSQACRQSFDADGDDDIDLADFAAFQNGYAQVSE